MALDATNLLTGSDDASARLWDRATGKVTLTLLGHDLLVMSVAMDHEHIATGSADKTCKVWDRRTGDLVFTLSGHGKTVSSVARLQ